MKINFEIISTILEPFITIHAAEKTPQLVQLSDEIQQLSNSLNLTGYRDTKRKMISVLEINRIQTSGKRVICQTPDGEYELHQRIYELAGTLPHNLFIRTSSSEIIRIAWIKEFVLTPTGMYQIILRDGQQTECTKSFYVTVNKRTLHEDTRVKLERSCSHEKITQLSSSRNNHWYYNWFPNQPNLCIYLSE